MIKFLKKDLVIIMKFILFVLPFFLLYAAISLKSAGSYLLFMLVSALALAFGATLVDFKYENDLWLCSLPVSRAIVVRGRYFSAIAGALLGLGLCYVSALLFGCFLPAGFSGGASCLNIQVFVAVLCVVVGLVSVFYPFYFRYGVGKGLGAFAAALIGLGILTTGLLRLIAIISGGKILILGKEFLSSPGVVLVQVLTGLEGSLGPSLLLALAVVFSTVMVLLSIYLSTRFYQRRDF